LIHRHLFLEAPSFEVRNGIVINDEVNSGPIAFFPQGIAVDESAIVAFHNIPESAPIEFKNGIRRWIKTSENCLGRRNEILPLIGYECVNDDFKSY
jgi:hypothetical protein